MPIDLALRATTGDGERAGALRNRALDSGDDGLGHRVGGVLIQGGSVAVGSVDVLSVGGDPFGQGHVAGGDGTGLVEDDGVDAS